MPVPVSIGVDFRSPPWGVARATRPSIKIAARCRGLTPITTDGERHAPTSDRAFYGHRKGGHCAAAGQRDRKHYMGQAEGGGGSRIGYKQYAKMMCDGLSSGRPTSGVASSSLSCAQDVPDSNP